jgi:outer membrane protein TolC
MFHKIKLLDLLLIISILGMDATTAFAQSGSTSFAVVLKEPQIDTPNLDAGNKNLASPNPNAAALSLSSIVSKTLENSPQMVQASAALKTANARLGMSRAELLPSFSYRVAAGPENSVSDTLTPTGSDRHHYMSASTRITQPLFNLPQYKDYMSNMASLNAAELRYQATKETVALNAVQSTVDLCVSRILIKYTEDQLVELDRILNFLQERVIAGASSQADLERARTRVLNAQQTKLEQQTIYRNSLLDLTRLTGEKPEIIQLPEENQLPALPGASQEIKDLVHENSLDIRALRKDVEAQHDTYVGEITKYLPIIGVSIEKDNTRNVHGTNDPWTDTRALAVLSWNFSLGGKEIYSSQLAGAELSNRQSKLDDQEKIIMQATDADLALLESSAIRVRAAQEEEAASYNVVKAVEAQLKSGRIGSLLDALDASERHYASRQRLLSALGLQMKTHAQLLMRLGMLSSVSNNTTGD